MKDIQAEQTMSTLLPRLNDLKSNDMQLERFRESVYECLNMQELTPYVLNKLIAKIAIGTVEVVYRQSNKRLGLTGGLMKFNHKF